MEVPVYKPTGRASVVWELAMETAGTERNFHVLLTTPRGRGKQKKIALRQREIMVA